MPWNVVGAAFLVTVAVMVFAPMPVTGAETGNVIRCTIVSGAVSACQLATRIVQVEPTSLSEQRVVSPTVPFGLTIVTWVKAASLKLGRLVIVLMSICTSVIRSSTAKSNVCSLAKTGTLLLSPTISKRTPKVCALACSA